MTSLVSVDFEIFGKVQGVYFRKHTMQKATTLGVKGWCMNTAQGTVKGQLQGAPKAVVTMKTWLKTTGSPKCQIEKSIFKNETPIPAYTFHGFVIKI